MNDLINVTEQTTDVFFDKYQPIENTISDTRIVDVDGKYVGFETYGADIQYVLSIANTEPKRVWTMVDADGGIAICSGYHLVNRICYFITPSPAESENETYYDEDDESEWQDEA